MKSYLSNLSYLGYFSLISNLNNTKLVERSDWTIVDTTTLEFYAYSTSLQYTKALLVNTNSYQVLTFTPLKSDLAPL